MGPQVRADAALQERQQQVRDQLLGLPLDVRGGDPAVLGPAHGPPPVQGEGARHHQEGHGERGSQAWLDIECFT